MNRYKNVLNFAILAAIVMFVIHCMCGQNEIDNFGNVHSHINYPRQQLVDIEGMENVEGFADVEPEAIQFEESFPDSESESSELVCDNIKNRKCDNWNILDSDNYGGVKCKIEHSDKVVDNYIFGSLLGRDKVCPDRPVSACPEKMPQDALQEHLRLRDITYQDSHQDDTVDRVNNLYLANENQIARGYEGKKIGDLYDQLTQPSQYQKTCARMPNFDTSVEKGYYDTNGPQEFTLKGKMTDYNKEHSSNGGPIEEGLYGHDPYSTNHFSLKY